MFFHELYVNYRIFLKEKFQKSSMIKNKINLNDIKILQIPPKRAITGELILEIFKPKRMIKIDIQILNV